MTARLTQHVRRRLRRGLVIPAHPLALTPSRRLDERHQRALTRYYLAAGAGGLAVGVHTTQFEIHQPDVGLYGPVLALARETAAERPGPSPVLIAGIVGRTRQALREARLARDLGYHIGLVGLTAFRESRETAVVEHLARVAEVLPVMGFYLQPAVGGRALSYGFWRRILELEGLVAIKIAPFDRYRSLDVLRAVADSGRRDVALYTGNDDHIVADLVTRHRFRSAWPVGCVGGLLGQWAVWTRRAVDIHQSCRTALDSGTVGTDLLTLGSQLTDANAAIFDQGHQFRGCIPGIHEVLRRQGLLRGTWCLDPTMSLSRGQGDSISRVTEAYPGLTDDAFVRDHLSEWFR